MQLLLQILIGLVAAEHAYFFYFEFFKWESRGPKVFGRRGENFYKDTKAMAANQGLYNAFLAAGLIWTFFIESQIWRTNVSIFFLSCVVLAGLYGAYSVDKKIFWVQGMPALLALVIILSSGL